MALSVSGAMSNYTYGSGTAIRPKIDKNDNGAWSKAEVNNFAKAYKSATGNEIDVDGLFEKYGVNDAGEIDFNTQQQIYKDDALNLKALANNSTPAVSSDTVQFSLEDMLSKMSTNSKLSLSQMVFRTEQNSNLINAFGMDTTGINDLMNSVISAQNYKSITSSGGNMNSYLGQMMNMLV